MPFDPQPRVEALPRRAEVVSDNSFLASVYRWMFAGLALTGVVAMWVASNPQWVAVVAKNRMGLIILQLAVVLGLSFLLDRLSPLVASLAFLAYAAITGVV